MIILDQRNSASCHCQPVGIGIRFEKTQLRKNEKIENHKLVVHIIFKVKSKHCSVMQKVMQKWRRSPCMGGTDSILHLAITQGTDNPLHFVERAKNLFFQHFNNIQAIRKDLGLQTRTRKKAKSDLNTPLFR